MAIFIGFNGDNLTLDYRWNDGRKVISIGTRIFSVSYQVASGSNSVYVSPPTAFGGSVDYEIDQKLRFIYTPPDGTHVVVEYPILAVNTHNLGANAGPLFVSGDSDATLAHPGDRRRLGGTFYELDLDFGTSETDFTARIVSDINAKLQPDERLQWGTLTTSEPIQLQNRLTLPLTIQLIAAPGDQPPLFEAVPIGVQTATITIWENVHSVAFTLHSDHDRHTCTIFPDLANRARLEILHTNFLTAGNQKFTVRELNAPSGSLDSYYTYLGFTSGHDTWESRGDYYFDPPKLYPDQNAGTLNARNESNTPPDGRILPDLALPGFPTTANAGLRYRFGGILDSDQTLESLEFPG